MSRRAVLSGIAAVSAGGLGRAAPAGAAPLVSRGFNLPGWVDRADGTAPSDAVLEALRGAGFASVRLPVSAERIAARDATAAGAELAAIAGATRRLLGAGFAVLLDMHPSGELGRALEHQPEPAFDLLESAWSSLAGLLADFPAGRVLAELLNEPPLQRDAWLGLRERLAAAVRSRCPQHMLVWGPARFQGIWELAGTPPLADPNQLAAIHYYTPLGFTHQCQNWNGSPLGRLANLPFPATRDSPEARTLAARLDRDGDEEAAEFLARELESPWSVGRIDEDFAAAALWSRDNGCPLVLDEFGVLDFCVDARSRATWIGAVRRAAEANGIGWMYWEVDRGFGFIADRRDPAGFDAAIIDALVGRA